MREISEFLRSLNDRISKIEFRLAQLEYGNVILEETKVPSKRGEIEGKSYLNLPNGGIAKVVRVSFCDHCGRKATEFNICTKCGNKLCSRCFLVFRNKIYCLDCLKEILPLEKQEYQVLAAISNGIKSSKEISEILKIKKKDVIECKEVLSDYGLIERKGLLRFSDISVTNLGLEVLETYRKVYEQMGGIESVGET